MVNQKREREMEEAAAAAARLKIFMKWAAELGISDSPLIHGEFQNPNDRETRSCLGKSLSISYFPDAGGRGLGALRDLPKGELVLRVPKSALMTSQSLMANDHRLSVSVPKFNLSPTQILTVALLNEVAKGKRSWWYPYLTQFPGSYDTLASFSEFEIQALQLDDAIWTAEKAVEKTKSEWKNATALMEELMFKPHYMSFKAWIWASASISSRTMHISWDAAGCFCPVGDFFNYAAPGEEQTTSIDLATTDVEVKSDGKQLDSNLSRLTDGVFEEDSAAYCFYARKDYKTGDQVLLSYGTYTNLELLEHYGFILDKNPNDKAFIPLPPDLYTLCPWPRDSLYIHQNGKPSFVLLCAMRLWATPINQRKSVGHLTYSGLPISTENEIVIMDWIAKKCRFILMNLPTTIAEDKLLLSTINKDFHSAMELRNALSALKDEACNFMKVNSLLNEETSSKTPLSRKVILSLEKWKLAIHWRLTYKVILDDCIMYCTRVMDDDLS